MIVVRRSVRKVLLKKKLYFLTTLFLLKFETPRERESESEKEREHQQVREAETERERERVIKIYQKRKEYY